MDGSQESGRKKKKHKKHKVSKRKRERGTNDVEQLETKRRHTEEVKQEEELCSNSIDDREHVTSEGAVKKPSSWHMDRNQDLLSDIMREYEGDDLEDEEFKEEGVLAELHRTFTPFKELDQLRERCGDWRTGKWSLQEMNMLKHNISLYMKQYKIVDLPAFIFDRQQRCKRIEMFRCVAKGIHRPLFLIYRKLIRIFNAEHYVGRWTEEMEKRLLELRHIHGNKWTLIGAALGVSGAAAMHRYEVIYKTSRNKGLWSPEEKRRLATAVSQLRGENWKGGDTELPVTACWEDVANIVDTRSAKQCHSKWVSRLTWKEDGITCRDLWPVSNYATLIERLNTLEAEDEEEVDWIELAREWPYLANGSSNTRVRYLLRTKWNILRRSVPHYFTRTFQENLDYLVEHKLPDLKLKAIIIDQSPPAAADNDDSSLIPNTT